jgi:tetratricopeptide (TPR) repeat protein
MDEATYRILVRTAIVMAVLWVGWTIYDGFMKDASPDSQQLAAAFRFMEDGRNQEALHTYQRLLDESPDNLFALRGKAQALMQIGEHDSALIVYDEVIRLAPEAGVTYANRGILKDRMGDYRGALDDYEKALALEPEVAEGPGFLTRFLRKQAEKPPTVADRARYLREQLAKPETERLLRLPEKDEQQRPYKL